MSIDNASKVAGFMRDLGVIGVAFEGGVSRYVTEKPKKGQAVSDEPIVIGEGENQLKLEPFTYWSFPDDAWCITSPKRAPFAIWSDWLALARKIVEREGLVVLDKRASELLNAGKAICRIKGTRHSNEPLDMEFGA